MDAWVELIGAIVGGLIAGGAAWLNSRLQFRYQQERERKTLLLIRSYYIELIRALIRS